MTAIERGMNMNDTRDQVVGGGETAKASNEEIRAALKGYVEQTDSMIAIHGRVKELANALANLKMSVNAANEASEVFQNMAMKLESDFGLFRRLYWKLKDEIDALKKPPSSDDSATMLPPSPKE